MEATLDRPISSSYRIPLDLTFLFHSNIPPGPRILYMYLVYKSDRDDQDLGLGIPMETLGRILNMSYATCWKHIQKLQQLGFLRVEQNRAGHKQYFPQHYWSL